MAAPRPARGFTSQRAERWVLTSALLTGLVYLVRRLVEGETSSPPSTSAARQFLGSGAPPTVGQWFIAYGTAYLSLSILAALAPEAAASLAALAVAGTFIESGGQLATDLQNLEHGAGSSSGPTAAQIAAQAQANAQNFQKHLIPTGAGTGPVVTANPNGTVNRPFPGLSTKVGNPLSNPFGG